MHMLGDGEGKSSPRWQMARPGRSRIPVLALFLSVMSCGPSLTMRVPDVRVVRARTVVLPATILAYDLNLKGEHLDEDKQTKALERTIGTELDRQAKAKGALPLSFDKVRACGDNCISLLSTAIRWGAKSAMEIAQAKDGVNHSGRSSVGQWQNLRDLNPLRRAMDADFTLVAYVRDVHHTADLTYVEGLKGPLAKAMSNQDDFRRIFAVCALALASGRVVWCSTRADRMVDRYLDLTSPKEARQLVEDLLAEF